jgi:hypothetical protein
MRWSDIQFRPPEKMLRQFAGLWLVFFGALASWQWLWRDRPTAALIIGTLAVTIGPIGLIWPRLIRPIYVAWMVVAFPIGWIVSNEVLALIFYGLFTPVALFFRLRGRDPLMRRARPVGETYYLPKSTPADMRQYLRQY